MIEREVAEQFAVTYLLVSAKRHLPCWKRHEHHAAWLGVFLQIVHKCHLVGNVFQHVMAYNKVELVFEFLDGKDISSDEVALQS